MKSIGFVIALLFSTSLFGQWVNLNSGTTQWLRAVWFTSQDTGYVAGYGGTILKTSNGGVNWITLPSGSTSDLQGIFFLNSTTGWAVGSGTILKTADAGASWTPQLPPISSIFHQVQFLDMNTGYIAGESGVCLKTTDGGATWNNLTLTSGNGKVSLFFHDVNNGFFSGLGWSDAIVKTSDGGATWTNVYPNTVQEFCSITFKNLNEGFAVSSMGQMAKSTDGGNSWTTQNSGAPSLYCIAFPSSQSGYTVGGYPNTGSILHTADGGSTWTSQVSGTTSPLFGVFFTDASTGYAVGKNGTIIKTTNGGVGMEESISSETFSLFPNPAENFLNIRLQHKTPENYVTMVEDLSGKQLTKIIVPPDQDGSIDVSLLPAGIYIVRLVSSDRVLFSKFVKL